MKTRRLPFLLCIATALGLVTVGGVMMFQERILLAIGNNLVVKDALQQADVIHVIAGEDYRSEYAIELYQQGYGKLIFFTGGWCETHQYNHGSHGKDVALAAGVPEQDIAFDDSMVTSTYGEVERLKDWVAEGPNHIRSVIVVSDPYHMRRAQWTYRQVLDKGVRVQMAPVPIDQTPYQTRWWEDWRSKKFVKDEYIKNIYYLARYQWSRGPMRDWLASLDQE